MVTLVAARIRGSLRMGERSDGVDVGEVVARQHGLDDRGGGLGGGGDGR